jgi:SAM-dependent methyltransferase
MAEKTPPVEAPSGAEDAIEYGSFYYRHDCGVPYERNEFWLEFFGRIAEGIVRNLQPSSVLDAGCAMGFLVEALEERGVEAWGIDVSEFAISKVHESVAERCSVASLTEPLERRFDLIVCIEVLEHLPAADADRAIANLCASTDRLLLSSTPTDFGEATHLNVQPPEAWSAALAREGLLREVDRDFSFITPWAALYTRRDEPLDETVRRYDRSWWRLRREASEVRASLLEMQGRLAELEESALENRDELQGEVDRAKEEVLRLRDLLIGRDAELGAVKGQLAVVEDQNRRILSLAARIQGKIPGLMRVLGLLRRLRGRG